MSEVPYTVQYKSALMAGMQGTYQLPTLAIGDWQLISWRYAGCVCRICCLGKYSYIGNCQWEWAIADWQLPTQVGSW